MVDVICNCCKYIEYDSNMNGYCSNPESVYYRKIVLTDYSKITQCENAINK